MDKMTLQEKMKNGELYDCSMEKLTTDLEKKLSVCKELLYDFNNSRPSEGKKREEIGFVHLRNEIYITDLSFPPR